MRSSSCCKRPNDMTPPLYSIYWLNGLETIEVEHKQELPCLRLGVTSAFEGEVFEIADFQIIEEAREVIVHLSPVGAKRGTPWFLPSGGAP